MSYAETNREAILAELRHNVRWEAALRDASLGVGHTWTAVECPAYRTLDGADCTCNNNERK